MKKLMIAAVAAAMVGGVYADDLCNESGPAASGCSVYNVKFVLKTLAAKKKACDAKWLQDYGNLWRRYDSNGAVVDTVYAAVIQAALSTENVAVNDANLGATVIAKRDLYWMDNATRKWEGVLWQCTAACFQGDGANRVEFVMWEAKAKRAMSFPAFRAYNKDKASYRWFSVNQNFNTAAVSANEDSNFWFLGRYGQKATKVAVGWNPTVYPAYGFHAAGFGSFDAKNKRMTSVSGNCVGLIRPLVAGKEDDCGNGSNIFVIIAPLCTEFKQWCCDGCYYGEIAVPASGTWTLKYNSSLSKGTKPLSSIIPAYAVFSTDNYTAAQINLVKAGDGVNGGVDAAGFFMNTNGIVAKDQAASASLTEAETDAVAAAIAPVFYGNNF
jgi:hypothetical protein